MKKIINLLLVMVMALSLAACGGNKTEDVSENTEILTNESEQLAETDTEGTDAESNTQTGTQTEAEGTSSKTEGEGETEEPKATEIEQEGSETEANTSSYNPEQKLEDTKPEQKPADTKGEQKPADTKQEQKPANTKEEQKPANTKQEQKPANTKEEQKPADNKTDKNDKGDKNKEDKKEEDKKEEDKKEDTSSATLGQTLLAVFKKKADGSASTQELADALITNKAILFMGGSTPVEPGLLPGFDNTEITGFKEGTSFGPMMGSIAFIGYVFEVEDGTDVEAFKKLLKDNANPRWQICVEAEETIVDSVGNTVFFLMCPRSLEQ